MRCMCQTAVSWRANKCLGFLATASIADMAGCLTQLSALHVLLKAIGTFLAVLARAALLHVTHYHPLTHEPAPSLRYIR